MFAVKRIELRVVRGAVFGTEPPAPVAALSGKKRLVRFPEPCFRWRVWSSVLVRFGRPSVSFAGIPKQFPCSDVFAVANPHIEIGVNPGARKNLSRHWDRSPRGNGFTGSESAKVPI